MSKHKTIRDLLASYAFGELSPNKRTQVESHLAECQSCRTEVQYLEALLDSTRDIAALCPNEQVCESAKESIYAVVDSEQEKSTTDRVGTGPGSVWRTTVTTGRFKLATAAVIVVTIGLFIANRGPDEGTYTPTPGDAAKSPNEMMTAMSLTMAYRQGGIEAVEKLCKDAIEKLGPRPHSSSVGQLRTSPDSQEPERRQPW